MNNTVSLKTYILLCEIFISIVFLEGSFKELSHNHEPDYCEHENCPVLILNQALSSGITVSFEFPSEHFVKQYLDCLQNIFHTKSEPVLPFLRSPPLI
jgi:hypothetical protein